MSHFPAERRWERGQVFTFPDLIAAADDESVRLCGENGVTNGLKC
jgi:hypothetical protein